MPPRFMCALAALAVLAAAPAETAAQSLERPKAAAEAYRKGDYETAHRLWLALAEEGNRGAYYNLGLLFTYGRGVSLDLVEGYKWFLLADRAGLAAAKTAMTRLDRLMTDSDRAEAERRAERWYDLHPALRPR